MTSVTQDSYINQIISDLASNDSAGLLSDYADYKESSLFDINATNTPFGWTILIAACHYNRKDAVIMFLKDGADPNITNPRGTTPLMYAKTSAFGSGQSDIMDYLITAGAKIDAKDIYGKTALDYIKDRSNFLINYFTERKK